MGKGVGVEPKINALKVSQCLGANRAQSGRARLLVDPETHTQGLWGTASQCKTQFLSRYGRWDGEEVTLQSLEGQVVWSSGSVMTILGAVCVTGIYKNCLDCPNQH